MQALISRVFLRQAPTQPPAPDTPLIELSAATRQTLRERGLLLAFASEMGFIDDMVDMTQRDLEAAGMATRPLELNDVTVTELQREPIVLFLTSTTGSGDAPFAADQFSEHVMTAPAALAGLQFGLLSAGDSDYDEFCGFGHALRDWLLASGARPLFAPVDIDDEEEATIRHWRHNISQVFAPEPAHA